MRYDNHFRRMEGRLTRMEDRMIRIERLLLHARRIEAPAGSEPPKFYDNEGNECIFPAVEDEDQRALNALADWGGV